MKQYKSLSRKMLTQMAACIVVLLALATPLFYSLTKHYYAEDMLDIIEAVGRGQSVPATDLEEDILQGVMIQFGVITLVLAVAIMLTLRFISRRLWQPFDETLRRMEDFRLEQGTLPCLPESDVREFARLNRALLTLMKNSLASYRTQKEFTENASHELQTPLAVFQLKLDLLLQQPGLTEGQAAVIQDLYQMNRRLSHLSRGLLLLAKIENSQYEPAEQVDVVAVARELLPSLETLADGLTLHCDYRVEHAVARANRTLLEILLNNLVVNAVRHNRREGEIALTIETHRLTVSNTSDEGELDARLIFNRFYRPSEKVKGNGLGLAIVKAICDYHGWRIDYRYDGGRHHFILSF